MNLLNKLFELKNNLHLYHCLHPISYTFYYGENSQLKFILEKQFRKWLFKYIFTEKEMRKLQSLYIIGYIHEASLYA